MLSTFALSRQFVLYLNHVDDGQRKRHQTDHHQCDRKGPSQRFDGRILILHQPPDRTTGKRDAHHQQDWDHRTAKFEALVKRRPLRTKRRRAMPEDLRRGRWDDHGIIILLCDIGIRGRGIPWRTGCRGWLRKGRRSGANNLCGLGCGCRFWRRDGSRFGRRRLNAARTHRGRPAIERRPRRQPGVRRADRRRFRSLRFSGVGCDRNLRRGDAVRRAGRLAGREPRKRIGELIFVIVSVGHMNRGSCDAMCAIVADCLCYRAFRDEPVARQIFHHAFSRTRL